MARAPIRRLIGVSVLVIGATSALWGCGSQPAPSSTPAASNETPVKLDAEFHAVVLTGGQVFFGKLEGFGTRFPVLREVYYVRTSPGEKPDAPPVNTLIKRGQEWHAPDSMILNADHIVLVEPVASTSKLAELIAQERQQK